MLRLKSVLCLLLVLLLCGTFLVSCGDDAEETSSDMQGNQNNSNETVSADDKVEFPYEDYYNDVTIKILCVESARHTYGELQFVPNDESNYTAVSEAVRSRNDLIEQNHGIKIEIGATQYPATELRTLIESGICEYDLVCESVDRMVQSVSENLFWSLDDVIDYEYPWWDQEAIESISIAGRHYFLAGDCMITDDDNTYLYLYNKDMYEDNATLSDTYGNLYQLVREGEFTLDVFEEMCKVVSQPSEDGLWDFYATYGNLSHAYGATVLMNGCDFATASPDETGYFTINVGTDHGISLFDKVYSLMSNKQITQRAELIIGQGSKPSTYGFAELEEMFVNGRGLFYNTTSSSISILKTRSDGLDFEFGVLPIPKYDEHQTRYCNTVNRYHSTVMGIPISTSENLEAATVLMQALGYYSEDVTDAYYQQTLQLQALTANDDAEMLDLIYENRFYDLGAMFNWGNDELANIYGKLIANDATNQIASYWDSVSSKVTTAMEETVKVYQESLT